jgi:TolA-binding protein
MSKPSKLPVIEVEALRDHGNTDKIEKIWAKLEPEIRHRRAPVRGALWWAPAAAVIVFGAGVFVGARWMRSAPADSPSLAAEPPARGDEPSAAPASPAVSEPETTLTERQSANPVPQAARKLVTPAEEQVESLDPIASPPTASMPPAAGPPEWQRLAQQGEYAAANRAIDALGGFDAVLNQSTAEQLMSLVDVVRATGQRARAVAALRRVVERFPGDPNAPLAAWTLANLLERSGDKVGAQKAFAAYRALSPRGDFAEDALARQVEAALEQNNLELAQKLADQYEKDFPNGRRLRELRAELAKKTGAREADAGAKTDDEKPSGEPEEEGTAPPAVQPGR